MRQRWESPVPRRWLFEHRADAGAHLARALGGVGGPETLVLGIPRGGVPVAAEVARRLGAELDVVVARKLPSPAYGELAIGAVTARGGRYLNTRLLHELRVSDAYLDRMIAAQLAEARAREDRLRAGRPASAIVGRTVIVVDDGLATGATMLAAVRAVRQQHPTRLIVAVPVGAEEACDALATEVDEIVCLYVPRSFLAVGLYYADFEPPSENDVRDLLAAVRARRAAGGPQVGVAGPMPRPA